MHIYAFGSVCRGEVDKDSDIDLLALVEGFDERFDPSKYSIYSYQKMRKLWSEGSPFAWHLTFESRLLFASDSNNFLGQLGEPANYRRYVHDCEKFLEVFCQAKASLLEGSGSRIFDLSAIFLSARNISTCFSLGVLGRANFSRDAALQIEIEGAKKLPMSMEVYSIVKRARILCTRGMGDYIGETETFVVIKELEAVEDWMRRVVEQARDHERIQQSR